MGPRSSYGIVTEATSKRGDWTRRSSVNGPESAMPTADAAWTRSYRASITTEQKFSYGIVTEAISNFGSSLALDRSRMPTADAAWTRNYRASITMEQKFSYGIVTV